jgi:hypothetical protein
VLLNSYSQEEDKTGVLARLVQLGSELVSLLTLLDSGPTEHLNSENLLIPSFLKSGIIILYSIVTVITL